MSTKFYTLLTDIGAAKLANATALGVPLKITHMAVGDGGGTLPTPSAQQTKLISEQRRAALNQLYIDPQNASQMIAEQVIPENEGGWWIREVGLFDESGALIAVGNCAESYKPLLAEGSGRTQTVRMILITSSTENITLKIDPSIVLATRKYVDDKVIELTAYIDKALAIKQPLDKTLSELSGKSVAELLKYLGLTGAQSGTFPIGMPFYWPSEKMPNEVLSEWSAMEFLKWNGASFSASKYPKLAMIIPSLTLTEARGEFLRIWDDGRGVDRGRALLSKQDDGIPKLAGDFQSYDIGGYEGASGIFSARKFSGYVAAINGNEGEGTDILVSMDSSTVIPVANEVRPRNIAFNFLVRAK
ncbi:phage tail protein [Tatumella sp. OPLPL6]|uniref:phage tail protein n=1 Tax=Tatumella sp. OPLPL6 TaxID=1928657 RepID=UPI000C1A27E3|nr:phage tail protein [Tatumella sp. OPLPL6]PIJ42622.1 phage tail protein [Tatumella sp. OPLPL6]